MLKKLELSGSQHQAWDKFCDDRIVAEARLAAAEKRFLSDCLQELGGKMTEPWQFDAPSRTFWMDVKEPGVAARPPGQMMGGFMHGDFKEDDDVAAEAPKRKPMTYTQT